MIQRMVSGIERFLPEHGHKLVLMLAPRLVCRLSRLRVGKDISPNFSFIRLGSHPSA